VTGTPSNTQATRIGGVSRVDNSRLKTNVTIEQTRIQSKSSLKARMLPPPPPPPPTPICVVQEVRPMLLPRHPLVKSSLNHKYFPQTPRLATPVVRSRPLNSIENHAERNEGASQVEGASKVEGVGVCWERGAEVVRREDEMEVMTSSVPSTPGGSIRCAPMDCM